MTLAAVALLALLVLGLGFRVWQLGRELAKLHHRLWNLERGRRPPHVEFERLHTEPEPPPPPRPAGADLEALVRERMRAGRKIEAVKAWREATGDSLQQSVEAVERIGRG